MQPSACSNASPPSDPLRKTSSNWRRRSIDSSLALPSGSTRSRMPSLPNSPVWYPSWPAPSRARRTDVPVIVEKVDLRRDVNAGTIGEFLKRTFIHRRRHGVGVRETRRIEKLTHENGFRPDLHVIRGENGAIRVSRRRRRFLEHLARVPVHELHPLRDDFLFHVRHALRREIAHDRIFRSVEPIERDRTRIDASLAPIHRARSYRARS